ncbi:putative monooxygenase [Thozetella sp. PMI_491]|nr:putative monooxygenase [Thozetella sp. PMI_491]
MFFQTTTAEKPSEAPSSDTQRYPPSGIAVLVVGAGPGGLFAALECWRKGHEVRIIERQTRQSIEGDFMTVGPSVIRHIQKFWPWMAEENERIVYDPWMSYHKLTGECIVPPGPFDFGVAGRVAEDGEPGPQRLDRHSRPKFVRMLLTQLERLGLKVEYDKYVVDYYEDRERRKGGAVLHDGERLEADIVIAADGVGTKSHKLINGEDIKAYSSGMAAFRTAYPVDRILADRELDERFPASVNGHPVWETWAGKGMGVVVLRTHDIISWLVGHRDTGNSEESWHHTVGPESVLEVVSAIPGWPEYMNKLIKTAPEGGIVDWKIMWRSPQSNWTSPQGRVVQLGDSSHTFLPSSGNGANQAMEDAVSLAACLQIGGASSETVWATKVHNKLRFDRVSCCQLVGFYNLSHQLNPNWDAAAKDAKAVKPETGRWIWGHNADRYTYENYARALNHLQSGAPFQNTNIPPGYTLTPWTIEQFLAKIEAGEPVEFSGDWS